MREESFQYAKLRPGGPGERWVRCWTLAWVKLEGCWQPGLIRLWVKAAPDRPWLVQVDYEAVRMGRRQRDLKTLVYDPVFIRPLPLLVAPED